MPGKRDRGRPTTDPNGIRREGRISARVLPETKAILVKAAGSQRRLGMFLDEVAKIIGNLKPPDDKGTATAET